MGPVIRRLAVLLTAAVAPGAFAAAAFAAGSPSWRLQRLPNLSTARQIALSGVSCPRARPCTAVGSYYDTAANMRVTLAVRWNGKKWVTDQTVNPPESVGDSLSGVSCTPRSACQAVGAISYGEAGDDALAEGTSGASSWTYEPFPFITGASSSFLEGVSCSTASACTAVGGYFVGASTNELNLAGRWNGTRWIEQAVPLPSGSASAGLDGVSCPSATRCVAVGGPSGHPFAETWNGGAWTVEVTPMPVGLSPGGLYAVSCSSTSACVAVGDYVNNHEHTVAVSDRWNGMAWKIVKVLNSPGTSGSNLLSVSCPSASDCTAVGWYFREGKQAPLAEGWNGKQWKIQPTAKPSPSGRYPQLDGVSCSSKSDCTAVGSYDNNAGNPKGAFIERRR